MMQIDIKNAFNITSQTVNFRELRKAEGPLMNIVSFINLFYGVHSSFYYQHGQHELKGVTIIESSLGTRQGDPLKGPLFALAHY